MREPDITPPMVSVNQAADQNDPTSSNVARFIVVFSELIDVNQFTASDISVRGTNGQVTQGPTANADGVSFTFLVTGMSDGDMVEVDIPANVVSDLSGNSNLASTSQDNSVTFECDQCEIDDQDGDGISDFEDNCPEDANPDQNADICADSDGICFPLKTMNDIVTLVCL